MLLLLLLLLFITIVWLPEDGLEVALDIFLFESLNCVQVVIIRGRYSLHGQLV